MAQERWKRDHDETGCQPPEGPFLCVNNCGFFGSSATMNLCSKCYRDLLLKQVKAKAASPSIDSDKSNNNNNNNNNNNSMPDVVFGPSVEVTDHVGIQALVKDSVVGSSTGEIDHGRDQAKAKQGANRCSSCKKRVGLTGFNCRCGNVFCSLHRYSDKHDCPFDYRAAGRDAIAKANPVVKAEKVDKI